RSTDPRGINPLRRVLPDQLQPDRFLECPRQHPVRLPHGRRRSPSLRHAAHYLVDVERPKLRKRNRPDLRDHVDAEQRFIAIPRLRTEPRLAFLQVTLGEVGPEPKPGVFGLPASFHLNKETSESAFGLPLRSVNGSLDSSALPAHRVVSRAHDQPPAVPTPLLQ